MPGSVKIARIVLYVVGAFNLLSGALVMISAQAVASGDTLDAPGLEDYTAGALYTLGLLALLLATTALTLASRMPRGRRGLRIGAITLGALVTVIGIINVLTGQVTALADATLGALLIANCCKQDAKAYFERPRH
ncbi:hypothetical protein H9Y04_45295 [Streptomyces sp. TRM66268-LWL]|uniref:Integral membrane protein n=1 Tax=Streptomyces polyasparticus TaxID=2767826 RepID=A0ABR7SYQ9_9ACTN|nr:hypothetical protein [Streptomyces polyasparticus]MBC9719696.1 hypothetical protein [Streptomyces polyasparticus]